MKGFHFLSVFGVRFYQQSILCKNELTFVLFIMIEQMATVVTKEFIQAHFDYTIYVMTRVMEHQHHRLKVITLQALQDIKCGGARRCKSTISQNMY